MKYHKIPTNVITRRGQYIPRDFPPDGATAYRDGSSLEGASAYSDAPDTRDRQPSGGLRLPRQRLCGLIKHSISGSESPDRVIHQPLFVSVAWRNIT
ncbi:hypothetical protein LSAT2_013937, partial [Lamellibrachia satsuma]